MKAPRARLRAGRSSMRTIDRREIAVEIDIDPREKDERVRAGLGRDAWRRAGLLVGLLSAREALS
eukprot:scaffold92023_cov61-Phaeocystis_antarctica.AAC.1